MKSIIKILAILLVIVSTTSNTFANIYPTIKLVENKTLAVNFNDWAKKDVTITIMDIYGTILHIDRLENKGIDARRYNLKYLPDGKYELLIESEMKKAIHDLEVKSGAIQLLEKNVVIFKPTVRVIENNIELNQLALGRAINVSISDDGGVFFTKDYTAQNTINKRYDISKLPKGNYTFTVQGDNQYDTYEFVK